MLSLYTLKSAKDASTYYQQGDYYTQGGAEDYSFWWGKGAKTLGLQGAVHFETFKELLKGNLPNNERMMQTQKGQYHRPGYDLTFSAPKSVSILALVLGDKSIQEAHRQAVKSALSQLEKKEAAFRLKHKGNVEIVKTGNYLVGAFEHSDSRAGDPHLHTHTVLLNMTQREDKAWRAIYADELYDNKLLYGMEYRAPLARQLLQLGFELSFGEKGLFEIKGMPEPLMEFWSKRGEEISDWLKEQELTGGKAAAQANFQTRGAKVKDNPDNRLHRWHAELKELGFDLKDLEKIVNDAKARGPIPLPEPAVLALHAVNAAIHHLSEKEIFFSMDALIKAAKWMSVLPCAEGELLKVIEQKIEHKALFYGENKTLTTPELISLQEKVVASFKEQIPVNRIAPPWIADLLLAFKSEELSKPLKALFIAKESQLLVSADAKKPLLNLLKDFNALVKDHGFYPRFLTQTQAEAASLKERLQTERVTTIAGFLLSCEERASQQRQQKSVLSWLNTLENRVKAMECRDIWVVRGDISLSQLQQLQLYAKQFHARLILTEVNREAAMAYDFLKKQGVKALHVPSNVPALSPRAMVLEQLEKLQKEQKLHEIGDYQERLQNAINLFQPNLQYLSSNFTECRLLNQTIRGSLKEQGILKEPSISANILQPLTLTKAEKEEPHLYQLNDIIRFNKGETSAGIAKGEYAKITAIDLFNAKISLETASNKLLEWELTDVAAIDVFRQEPREINQGDKLIWTRTVKHETDKSLDRIKNQTAIVTNVQGNDFTVTLKNGKSLSLNKNHYQNQHWDYGYALTLDKAHFNTESIVLLHHQHLKDKTLIALQELLSAEKSKITVLCEDLNKIRAVLSSNIDKNFSFVEAPYQRKEALNQSTPTQSIFHRLQQEYLTVSQQDPEPLKESLEKRQKSRDYSAEFKKACYTVETVILYHSERKAVFALKDIQKESRQLSSLAVSSRTLEGALNFALHHGWLVKMPSDNPDNVLAAARHTVMMEKLCLKKMLEGQNQVEPILSKESFLIKAIQEDKRLTVGQKEAIELLLTSKDTMAAIQGIAGAGKTTALKEVKRLCQEAAFKVLVLASTASAKNQAQASSKIGALTTAQFLTRLETELILDPVKAHKDYGGNQLIIVDEASLLATKEQFRLINIREKLSARLHFMGDFKQQGSIGAGRSLHDLLVYGINKAVMAENVRLTEPKALSAMKSAYAGDMKGTLQILKDTIEEIPNKEEALMRIVQIYTTIQKGREHVLIITPLNEDRHFINQAIREKLKGSQELKGDAITTSIFLPKDRREVEKREASSFTLTDVIRFNVNHPRLGINKGDYLSVTDIDLNHQRLTLSNEKGGSFYWHPKNLRKVSDIETYQRQTRELMPNDLIVFKRNQEQRSIFNGDRATVLSARRHQIEVLLANQEVITLDLTKPENQHLDYGYALTTFAVQGKEGLLVLAYNDGPKPRLKKTHSLKPNDIIILTPQDQQQQDPNYQGSSTIGMVFKVEKGIVTVRQKEATFSIKVEKNRQWQYFPPFEVRKKRELPVTTTQPSFLVDITRGDLFYLIVPYLSDFEKTLERHEVTQVSALSALDPKYPLLQQVIKRFIENIRGIKEEISLKITSPSVHSIKIEKHSYEESNQKWSSDFQKPKNFVELYTLNRFLESKSIDLVSDWLGKEPSHINHREARWGSKGSFCLNLDKMLWKDHETTEGGKGLVSLYQTLYKIKDWKEAVQELSSRYGAGKEDPFNAIEQKPLKKTREWTQQDKINYACKAYFKAIPTQGTLAETYLKTYRGLNGEIPADFRFSPMVKHLHTKKLLPALIAPIRDKEGKMTGIVRIFLNSDGSKYKDTYIDASGKIRKAADKANLGCVGEGAVVVQKGALETTVYVAEGIETALSVAKAIPNQTVLASLSVEQFKKIAFNSETQKIVICADRDESHSKTFDTVTKAIDHHLHQGKRVFIAIPDSKIKCDFNDVIQQKGIEAVKADLEKRCEIKAADLSLMRKEGFLEAIQNIQRSSTKEPLITVSKTPAQTHPIKKDLER